MGKKVDVDKTIKLESKSISSKTDEMYITDNYILLGSTRIGFSDIEDVKRIKSNERDYISYSIMLSNVISSIILGLTLTHSIYILIGFSLVGFTIGYLIVRSLKNNVSMYISMVTEETEYNFGVSTIFDAGEFFATIDEKTNIDLSYKNFVVDEKSEFMDTNQRI
jgi:F0F1-type ATP synthase assembly protein I